MAALFIGDHPAADFLNTQAGTGEQTVELIGDGEVFIRWLQASGLLAAQDAEALVQRVRPAELEGVAQQAREMREWARALLQRWSGQADIGDELVQLQQLLALCSYKRTVDIGTSADDGRIPLRWVPALERADALLGLLANAVAELVANESPASFKRCIGQGCSLSFVDRTKPRRRVYCSAASCGNRAKVAAFRARQTAHQD